MSSDAGPMWGQLILLLVLILVNAYFAAAEIAIVSVNKNRVRSLAQEGNKKAETLVKLIEDPNKFLSAIQVVITLAGFFSSAQAAFSFSGPVGAKLESWGIPYGGEMAPDRHHADSIVSDAGAWRTVSEAACYASCGCDRLVRGKTDQSDRHVL